MDNQAQSHDFFNQSIRPAIQSFNQLISQHRKTLSPEITRYCEEMLTTFAKLALETEDIGDIKMINTALKELRYSFKLFAPYRDTRKVCMFGSARTAENIDEYRMAYEFSNKITQMGYMIITGAGSGIMEAGNRGAVLNSSFGVNIKLPFEQTPNSYIAHNEKLMTFKYFFNRKVIFIKESDATVLFPGGFGTHDEAFETLTLIQTGKCSPRPIVLLAAPDNDYWDHWMEFIQKKLFDQNFISLDDLSLFTITSNVDQAIEEIINFYRIYHSVRYLRDQTTIIRLNAELSDSTLAHLTHEFQDIIVSGGIEKVHPDQLDINSEQFPDKHLIIFKFDRFHYGRLIQLIRQINSSHSEVRE